MATVELRDLTRQRSSTVEADPSLTVGEVLERGVRGMQLPTVSQSGMALEYTLRSATGSLLRPSESLSDAHVRAELTSGQCTAIPRLAAATVE